MSKAGNVNNIKQIPERLIHFLWSRIHQHVGQAKNLSAEIHKTDGQEARLVFGITSEETHLDEADHRDGLDEILEAHATETNEIGLPSCKIIVANVPPAVDEEVLEVFFESKKKGGGPVKNVQINRQMRWAVIEFCEEDAVDTVMGRLPVVLMGTELDIHRYSPSLQVNEVIQSLEIHGLPKQLTDDLLAKEIEESIVTGSDEAARAKYRTEHKEMEDVFRAVSVQSVTDLMPIQLRMLTTLKYPESLSDRYPKVKVKINHKRNEVVIEGSSTDITSVMLDIYKTLSSFSVYTIDNICEQRIELYLSQSIRDYINQKLNKINMLGVWEIRDRNLIVCSLAANIATLNDAIWCSVQEATFDVSKESSVTLLTPDWERKLEELNKKHKILLKATPIKDAVRIRVFTCTTEDILNETVEQINAFFRNKLLVEHETIHNFSNLGESIKAIYNVNKDHARKILEQIANSLSLYQVSIKFGISGSIIITGTWEGRQKAKQKIQNFRI